MIIGTWVCLYCKQIFVHGTGAVFSMYSVNIVYFFTCYVNSGDLVNDALYATLHSLGFFWNFFFRKKINEKGFINQEYRNAWVIKRFCFNCNEFLIIWALELVGFITKKIWEFDLCLRIIFFVFKIVVSYKNIYIIDYWCHLYSSNI